MTKYKLLKFVVFVVMKESMITITHYMLLAKIVLVDDVLNIIRKTGKKYWKKLNHIEKTKKIN